MELLHSHKDYIYKSKPNYSGYVVIGAGLPRTGTLSTRHALSYLLDGPIYHMEEVFTGKNPVSIINKSRKF